MSGYFGERLDMGREDTRAHQRAHEDLVERDNRMAENQLMHANDPREPQFHQAPHQYYPAGYFEEDRFYYGRNSRNILHRHMINQNATNSRGRRRVGGAPASDFYGGYIDQHRYRSLHDARFHGDIDPTRSNVHVVMNNPHRYQRLSHDPRERYNNVRRSYTPRQRNLRIRDIHYQGRYNQQLFDQYSTHFYARNRDYERRRGSAPAHSRKRRRDEL